MATAREQILEQLQQHGRMAVRDLADAAGVSPATAHRHLARLTQDGFVTRMRGAAQVIHQEHFAPNFEQRLKTAVEAKQQIARQALRFVPAGGSLFLDSSTTCLYTARAIERFVKSDVAIVTNSPVVVAGFSSATVRVIATPGDLTPTLRALGGSWTVEFLQGLNLDAAFISGIGITVDGRLTTTQRLLVDVLQQAIRRSDRVYILIDSSKIGHVGLLDIISAKDVAGVIVDSGIHLDQLRELKTHGINIIVAQESTVAD